MALVSLVHLALTVFAFTDVFSVVDRKGNGAIVALTLLLLNTGALGILFVAILAATRVIAGNILINLLEASAGVQVVQGAAGFIALDVVVVALPFLVITITDLWSGVSGVRSSCGCGCGCCGDAGSAGLRLCCGLIIAVAAAAGACSLSGAHAVCALGPLSPGAGAVGGGTSIWCACVIRSALRIYTFNVKLNNEHRIVTSAFTSGSVVGASLVAVLINCAHKCEVHTLTLIAVSLDHHTFLKDVALGHVEAVVHFLFVLLANTKDSTHWKILKTLKHLSLGKLTISELWQTHPELSNVHHKATRWSRDDQSDGIILRHLLVEDMALAWTELVQSVSIILNRANLDRSRRCEDLVRFKCTL